MAGFADILGSLVQSGLAQSGTSRLGNVLGGGQAQGEGSLGDMIGSLSGMLAGAGNSSGQSNMGGMLGDVVSNLAGNQAALGGIGALGAALLGGGGGHSSKGAIGGGALAMLASVAFSALKNSGQTPPTPPRALLQTQTAEDEQGLEEDAAVIVKAMINAAKADGAIDQEEMQKIGGKLQEDGLTEEERQFFMTESAKPLDLEGVINSAGGQPEMAAQIYAASLLAINVDTEAEETYLQNLGSGLGLDEATINYIEQSLGVQRG